MVVHKNCKLTLFIKEYPKLVDCGGFELLRASDIGGKELIPIEMPHGGYSVEYLQAVVKSAEIYIRTLQRDLDEKPLVNEQVCLHFMYEQNLCFTIIISETAEECCLTCGEFVPLHMLKEHVTVCKHSHTNTM